MENEPQRDFNAISMHGLQVELKDKFAQMTDNLEELRCGSVCQFYQECNVSSCAFPPCMRLSLKCYPDRDGGVPGGDCWTTLCEEWHM